jgi:hypothetical protein
VIDTLYLCYAISWIAIASIANIADEMYVNHSVVLKDKRNNWTRLREAIGYIYQHYYDEYDWFLKTNDNTFVVMENLRWLLHQYDTDWPVVLGQRQNTSGGMVIHKLLTNKSFPHYLPFHSFFCTTTTNTQLKSKVFKWRLRNLEERREQINYE